MNPIFCIRVFCIYVCECYVKINLYLCRNQNERLFWCCWCFIIKRIKIFDWVLLYYRLLSYYLSIRYKTWFQGVWKKLYKVVLTHEKWQLVNLSCVFVWSNERHHLINCKVILTTILIWLCLVCGNFDWIRLCLICDDQEMMI